MKITITNDKKESGENVFYVPSMLFASIVATLQEYGCLKRDAELQRAVDQHEQKCPICAGKGELMISLSGLEVCHTCKGTGHF